MPSTDYDSARSMTETLSDRLTAAVRDDPVSRRAVLGSAGLAGAAALGVSGSASAGTGDDEDGHEGHDDHGGLGAVGEYESDRFDPHEFVREFDTGEIVGEDDDGRRIRRFVFNAVDTSIEVAPGVWFDAWAFNDQVPGPTVRAVEGDRVQIEFRNGSEHAHTIHPHLRNLDPTMDGVPGNGPGQIGPGESFTYEWIAQPAGVHLYHCHAVPLKDHVHRGLYGMLVVDPDPDRVRERPGEYVPYHPSLITPELRADLVAEAASRNHERDENDDVDELVIVMNGFDTNFDGENEVYAANTRAFAYGMGEPDATMRPIRIDREERQRVYVVNATEFDPINSFHTHSQFFDYYDHGTTLVPTLSTVDTVVQCQAQRGIVELDYSDHDPGLYMFHAHQAEFAELGWMSFFEVA